MVVHWMLATEKQHHACECPLEVNMRVVGDFCLVSDVDRLPSSFLCRDLQKPLT